MWWWNYDRRICEEEQEIPFMRIVSLDPPCPEKLQFGLCHTLTLEKVKPQNAPCSNFEDIGSFCNREVVLATSAVTLRKTSLENKHLRNCEYFMMIPFCSYYTNEKPRKRDRVPVLEIEWLTQVNMHLLWGWHRLIFRQPLGKHWGTQNPLFGG